MRTPTRRLLGGLVLALGLAGTLPPAQAAEGSPPVAVDDKVKLRFGQPDAVDVLANDTDPDGDELAVCRLGPIPKGLDVVSEDELGLLFIAPRRLTAGRYTFTYYACDFESLVPATVTVTVTKAPEVKVQKMPERPGLLRVRNTAKFPVSFLYGSFREGGPDGEVKLAGRDSKFVKVSRTRINWIAIARRAGGVVDMGTVRNIKLPPGTQPPPSQAPFELGPRLSKSWDVAVSR
jgi:hypothetical protein